MSAYPRKEEFCVANRQELRTPTGKLISYIESESTGRLVGRAATGRMVGSYDPKSDVTRTPTGTANGKGNMLPVLIQMAH
jgi:hypothetical protein